MNSATRLHDELDAGHGEAAPADLPVADSHEARLLQALQGEGKLLRSLLEVLRRQRTGVAEDDLDTLEGSVYDAQRILATLAQARKRRRSLISLLTGSPETELDALAAHLGAGFGPELREAHDGLRGDARAVKRELAINRRILESASRSGEGFLRLLQGSTETPATYGPGKGSPPEASGGGTLLNRTI